MKQLHSVTKVTHLKYIFKSNGNQIEGSLTGKVIELNKELLHISQGQGGGGWETTY